MNSFKWKVTGVILAVIVGGLVAVWWARKVEQTRINRQIGQLVVVEPHDFAISRRLATYYGAQGNTTAALGWIMYGAVSGDSQSIAEMIKWQDAHCKSRLFPEAQMKLDDSFGAPPVIPWNYSPELAAVMETKMLGLQVDLMQPRDVCCAIIELSSAPKGAQMLAKNAETFGAGSGAPDGMGWWLFGIVRGDEECIAYVNQWLEKVKP